MSLLLGDHISNTDSALLVMFMLTILMLDGTGFKAVFMFLTKELSHPSCTYSLLMSGLLFTAVSAVAMFFCAGPGLTNVPALKLRL